MSAFDLSGRRALVTGSSRGIGLAIAEALATAGAAVVLHGRDRAALAAAAERLKGRGAHADCVVADLAGDDGPAALAAEVTDRFGGVDILVNNAGINIRNRLPDISRQDWDLVMRLDLTACMLLSQKLAPRMAENRFGRIVNVGSIMSVVTRPGIAAYTAAKHGLAGLTKTLAAELGPAGVTVNCVAPGFVLTEGTAVHQSNPEFMAMVEKRTPVGRWGTTEEIGGSVVFLASAAAGFVNGHVLVVDGGLTATI
jgi:gluconate 5-dehydrogenase